MTLAEPVGRAGGALLAALFGLTARLRGTRALHPVGVCGTARLAVRPGPPSGVVLLDDAGPHACLVRWSRATGRRGDGYDIEGLALRVEGAAAGDVLLAGTGTGVVGRHVLVPRRLADHGPVTTLLPLSTRRGPLLLRLDPVGAPGAPGPPTAYRLLVSAPGRPWHERGTLTITWTDRDCTRRHDPVGHPPAGAWTHPLWARLRDPSYAASQQVAADPTTPEGVPMTEHHDTHPDDPVRVSNDPEEVAKVHKIISDMDIAMLTTVDATSPGRLTSRPLSTQRSEADGDVLFLVRDRSPVVRDVEANPQVNVAYSSMKAWVSLAGTATVVRDRALVEELWSKGASAFMEGGPENPDNVVLRVDGDTAEYWGGESLVGTAVSTIKSITGREDEDSGATVVELP